jgi:DNA-binding transcriptional MerR regulator
MSIQPIRKYVAPEIPDKLYFRIGDVARLCEVPAYVLRFWETEFPQLRPNKGGTGQRLYRKRDVEMALRIKSLLYDQGYTIPGARQVFKNEAKARETAAAEAAMPVPAPAEPSPSLPAAAVPVPSAVPDRGEDVRRKAALRAVRDELCALLVILEQPVSLRNDSTPAKPAPRLQALRPRLVLEPKPAPLLAESLRLVTPSPQGDLFPGE